MSFFFHIVDLVFSYLNFIKQLSSFVKSQTIYPVYNQAAFNSLVSVWCTPRPGHPDLQKETTRIRNVEWEVGVKKVRTSQELGIKMGPQVGKRF